MSLPIQFWMDRIDDDDGVDVLLTEVGDKRTLVLLSLWPGSPFGS